MRNLFIFCFLFAVLPIFGQNGIANEDGTKLQQLKNLQKYWNMRHRFLGDNVKPDRYPGMIEVGLGQGKSIPAASRDRHEPNCGVIWDVPSPPCIGSQHNPNCTKYGALFWGDGTIFLGDYIALLATEWKLLDNCGLPCSTQKANTQVELFYALQALNRLDYYGEKVFGPTHTPTLNGFLARDDVPYSFAEPPCQNPPCPQPNYGNFGPNYILVSSGGADNELCPGVFDSDADCEDPLTTEKYGNTMSQDQVIGVLFGLSFVAKLVPDNIMVNGISLKSEAQEITTRIINYVKNGEATIHTDPVQNPLGFLAEYVLNLLHGDYLNFWTITDPNGEFVCRGPFATAFSFPLAMTAQKITGNNFHNTISYYIGSNLWLLLQLGIDLNQNSIFSNVISADDDVVLNTCYPPSNMSYCEMGLDLSCDYISFGVGAGVGAILNAVFDYCDPLANWTCDLICDLQLNSLDGFCRDQNACKIMGDYTINQFNLNMILKLAATSGSWSPMQLGSNAQLFKKEIYDLAGAVLNDYTPYTNSAYWELNVLNDAPCNNPSWDPNHTGFDDIAGWKSTYRWDKYLSSINGDPNQRGDFNGIDYMLAYNLYRLAFPNAGGPYLPLIERTITEDFPYTIQGNQFGDDNRPLTIQAARYIDYQGIVNPDGNVVLIAGIEVNFNESDILTGAEFDTYRDYMTCEPNYFDLGNGNSVAVLKTDGSNNGNNNNNNNNFQTYNYQPAPAKPAAQKNKPVNKGKSGIKISPNPNTGRFLVQNNFPIQSVEISNVFGETIYRTTVNDTQTEINLSSHSKGIYFVKIQSGEEFSVHKVVYQ